MLLPPIRIKPTEDALRAATLRRVRLSVVRKACRRIPTTEQKRLITTLYESEHITAEEALELILRLGLKEA